MVLPVSKGMIRAVLFDAWVPAQSIPNNTCKCAAMDKLNVFLSCEISHRVGQASIPNMAIPCAKEQAMMRPSH